MEVILSGRQLEIRALSAPARVATLFVLNLTLLEAVILLEMGHGVLMLLGLNQLHKMSAESKLYFQPLGCSFAQPRWRQSC